MLLQAKPQQMPFSGLFAGAFYAASGQASRKNYSFLCERASQPGRDFPWQFSGEYFNRIIPGIPLYWNQKRTKNNEEGCVL